MADYINREKLLKEQFSKDRYLLYYGDAYILVDDIKSAPSIDAVEVVRCKDCKFYVDGYLCCKLGLCVENDYLCSKLGVCVENDFFCKWGEKE